MLGIGRSVACLNVLSFDPISIDPRRGQVRLASPSRSYLVRCASMVSQACSASANVLNGDPASLMAGLLMSMGRQEATKPGRP
jgi:hypothetical protein